MSHQKINLLGLVFIIIILASCGTGRKASVRKEKINQVIRTAQSFKGTPYRYGGMTRKGVDCSGLLHVSFKSAGVNLPRSAKEQSKFGKKITKEDLQPGDLVFFSKKKVGRKVNHVGLVTRTKGRKKVTFIHASTSKGVIESNLSSEYYRKRYIKARRPI